MKFLKFVALNLIVFITFLSCAEDLGTSDFNKIPINPLESYEEFNISYGDDINQTFDLYLPKNRTNTTKIMVLVHGGGWSSGDKSDMNDIKKRLIKDFPELAVVNMNYKLADNNNAPYPMQINDISSVIKYLKTNELRYTVSNKIGFIGFSAGAHLSLLWSYAFDVENNVNMVCSIVGPTNFTDPKITENNTLNKPLVQWFGANPELSVLKTISPYHQVKKTAPATILFYGGKDPLIPISQGTALRDKLQDLDVTHEFTVYPEKGHGWDGIELLDTWIKLNVFIKTHLQN